MRRLWDVAVALIATMSLVTGSSGNLRSPATAPPPLPCPTGRTCHIIVGDDPAIVVYHGPFYSNLMPLTARLEWVDSESCLIVRREDQSGNLLRTLFPVWPEGARPVRAGDGRRGIELPRVGWILDGSLFQADGTSYSLNVSPPIPDIPTFRRPPGKCSAYDGYFIFDDWGISRMAG